MLMSSILVLESCICKLWSSKCLVNLGTFVTHFGRLIVDIWYILSRGYVCIKIEPGVHQIKQKTTISKSQKSLLFMPHDRLPGLVPCVTHSRLIDHVLDRV